MKTVLEYTKINPKVYFEQIEDKGCFFSSGVLYMKIFQQDLNFFKINNVNAISILDGGLTFFHPDETVNEAIREQISK